MDLRHVDVEQQHYPFFDKEKHSPNILSTANYERIKSQRMEQST